MASNASFIDSPYIFCVYITFAMNSYSSPVRVGVAGATGYAGQELVALLARHPNVEIRAAMSSGPDSSARPMPRLSHVFNGRIEPLDKSKLANDAELVFLAVPEVAAAELGG